MPLTLKWKIDPKGWVITPKQLEQLVVTAIEKTLDESEKDFESTVKDFDTKPTFVKTPVTISNQVASGEVYTTDENYCRLNYGVPPHPVGRTGKVLTPQPYRAKSFPGVVESFSGGREGVKSARSWTLSWRHSYIDARHFDELIAARHKDDLAMFTREGINDAIR